MVATITLTSYEMMESDDSSAAIREFEQDGVWYDMIVDGEGFRATSYTRTDPGWNLVMPSYYDEDIPYNYVTIINSE